MAQLTPLDFEDCRVDSPGFRDALKQYELATENLDKWLKSVVKDAKQANSASTRVLSPARC